MIAKKEIREERTDVIGFYVEKEIAGIGGTVTIEEQVDETTLVALQEMKTKLESDLDLVNEKITLAKVL